MDSHEIMQRIANSRIVFRDSFRDLEHFYNTINKDEIRFTIVSSDQLIKKFYCDGLRFVMNYLSSMYALKSLVQAQINNLNITEELKKEYACKIKYNFRDNALAMFVESCRNVFVHEGIPFAKIVFTGQKIELLVDVKELQKSPYFENKGKAYIKDKDVINFYEVCREHYNLTNSFYEWFWSNIQFNISAEHK